MEISSHIFILDGRKIISEVIRDVTDRAIKDRELHRRMEDLEKFYEVAIGREIRMKE